MKLTIRGAFFVAMMGAFAILRVPIAGAEGPTCNGLAPTQTCIVDGRSDASCVGTDGPDRIVGSPAADVIIGGAGNDHILAGAGDDVICAGAGDDSVKAGPGADFIDGGPGDDRIDGGTGNDELRGGEGVNVCIDGEDARKCDRSIVSRSAGRRRGSAAEAAPAPEPVVSAEDAAALAAAEAAAEAGRRAEAARAAERAAAEALAAAKAAEEEAAARLATAKAAEEAARKAADEKAAAEVAAAAKAAEEAERLAAAEREAKRKAAAERLAEAERIAEAERLAEEKREAEELAKAQKAKAEAEAALAKIEQEKAEAAAKAEREKAEAEAAAQAEREKAEAEAALAKIEQDKAEAAAKAERDKAEAEAALAKAEKALAEAEATAEAEKAKIEAAARAKAEAARKDLDEDGIVSQIEEDEAMAAREKAIADELEAAKAAGADKAREAAKKEAAEKEAARAKKAAEEKKAAAAAAPTPQGDVKKMMTAAGVPKPGTVIDSTNFHLYSEFNGPSIQWLVGRGVNIEVGEYRKVGHAPPFQDATERYAAQVELGDDGNHLQNWVAGLPFPTVDPDDERAGVKHMFNFNAAIARDDLDVRNFECLTGKIGGSQMRVERTFLIDHLRRLFFVGRTVVDPVPNLPNRDEVRYKEGLYPIIEPFDLKGVGFVYNRYLDHTRQDDSWLYLPQLRRVRRLSSSQRSDALFGQDTDQDSYGGYAGNIAWSDWKYLGEKTILGTFHGVKIPVEWLDAPAEYIHRGPWEPRKVWVVEGVSRLPQYAYGKRVIYLDQESYRIPYSDIYDNSGELWKVWINSFLFAKRPYPEAQHGFDYEIPYEPSITMVDMQLEHATNCALPSNRIENEQGWYVNMGEEAGTVEDYFEVTSLINAGR